MNVNWKLIGGIAAALVIVAGIILYPRESKDIIKNIEPLLTQEQKALFEAQREVAQQNVDAINSDVSQDEQAERYFLLARAHANLGDYEIAEKWFEKTIKTKKNYPLYLEYYNLLTAMHDYEKARDIARAGLEIFSINIDLWRSLIALEESQFNADDTRITNLHLEAMEKSEGQHELLADFAKLLEERGDKQEALKYWRLAAQKASDVAFYSEQVKRLEATQ